jgi:subtilisin family serine protease
VTHPPQLTQERTTLGLSHLIDELRRLSVPIEIVGDPQIFRFPGHKPTFVMHASPIYSGAGTPHSDIGRAPVAVVADPPPRGSRDTLPDGRRPVVALLDTKVERHDWLGEPGKTLGGDAFWVDATATEPRWVPGPRLDLEPESPKLGVYEGHGTFCAGLIRQLAPDAQVLAVHVARVHNRHVYGDHILNALGWLHHTGLVSGDVVCLPSGFHRMSGDDEYLKLLRRVLTRLTKHGIRVVAAAGNEGSSEPVYPAAFASTGVADGDRLVSVGAYDTDGKTPASFSNHGTWVTRWEIGTNVVSTFPAVDGAAAPGFARWSGTSFAAAIHAGRLARNPVRPSEEAAAPAHAVR